MSEFLNASLRIALLTHSVNPRGGVVHTLELAQALHDAGHRVTVMAPATQGQRFFRSLPCAVELIPVGAVPPDTAEMVASRIKAIEQHVLEMLDAGQAFDVLHAQDSISANALANLRDRGVIKGFVRTVHHLDHFDDPRLMAWQQRGFLQASQVMCVSRLWQGILRDEHGVDAALVHNGVDCQRYTAQVGRHDEGVRRRHGMGRGAAAGEPVFLMVGGIEERKNTQRVLEAFIQLRATQPKAQLVIIGGASLLNHDAYRQQFSTSLTAHGLAVGPGQAVVITGSVPDADMPALFRAADALLMPSLREGFGLVVLEALASGTPVVVSRMAPFTEYLGEADGLWVDPLSVGSISHAMQRALDPAHARALALETPAVCQRFSWPATALRHTALYRAFRSLALNREPPHARHALSPSLA
ncbi:MAG: MSMEG_0565 family glycosyltransferase [Aquabacterium sp.]|uniref:MSMEG_0565 family glycosyltransferase n=1 Tax=Aquabacterium sp. TaxID=1872578 RepID=UPI0027210A35|nr:MSMEG_0565 family glycosyltransferase [Aquabacterium sp.]MDO9003202.1 MSMEG_0565 family glycosyltransferase [Aquabacterium sp.]